MEEAITDQIIKTTLQLPELQHMQNNGAQLGADNTSDNNPSIIDVGEGVAHRIDEIPPAIELAHTTLQDQEAVLSQFKSEQNQEPEVTTAHNYAVPGAFGNESYKDSRGGQKTDYASEFGQLEHQQNLSTGQTHIKIQPNDYKSLSKQHMIGWSMREDQFRSKTGQVYAYLNRISKEQVKCFGGKREMIKKSLEGLDLHIMAIVDEDTVKPEFNDIHGLIIFSQENAPFRTSLGKSNVKIMIHHVSTEFEQQKNAIFDMALEYIWKHTHCCAIKLNLYKYSLEKGGEQVQNKEFQKFLKARDFRWKTMINEVNGPKPKQFISYELSNKDYVDQMRRSQAIFYRSGMDRENMLREPVSLFFSTMAALGKPDKDIDQTEQREKVKSKIQS